MIKSPPWDNIPIPTSDFNVLRVEDTAGVNIYWARDINEQCLLIVELDGNHAEQFRKDKVAVRGIDVDLRNGETAGQQCLVLTLARHMDCDLFLGLCKTLINSLKDVSDSAVAVSVALAHLGRWKAFLAASSPRRLSHQEVRGLFGELFVLRKLYQNTLSQTAAVESWCGPDASQQDFIFGDRAIEVKSFSGRERCTVRISSEDQLESLIENLFLLTLQITDRTDAPYALSLNGIVTLIENELTDAEAIEQFADKLACMSYAPLAEYDTPGFIVGDLKGYRVTNKFPRLIRSELQEGIIRVSYEIKLETIERFICDKAVLFRRL